MKNFWMIFGIIIFFSILFFGDFSGPWYQPGREAGRFAAICLIAIFIIGEPLSLIAGELSEISKTLRELLKLARKEE